LRGDCGQGQPQGVSPASRYSFSLIARDINLLLQYLKANEKDLSGVTTFETEICLPGLTEEFKMNVFFYFDKFSSLKLAVAHDQQSGKEYFEQVAMEVFKEFELRKISETLDLCEKVMYEKECKVWPLNT